MASCSQARSFSPTHAAITAKYLIMVLADKCIFFHRKKLNCAAAFAQRFLFSAEAGIDHAQHAPCRAEIWLRLDDFLLLCACSGKSQLRFALVVCHARDEAFDKWTIELNLIANENSFSLERAQGSLAATPSRSASAH